MPPSSVHLKVERRGSVVFGLAVGTYLSLTVAHAADPTPVPARLQWRIEGPAAACPTASEMERAVQAVLGLALGHPVFDRSRAPDIEVEAVVHSSEPQAIGWMAQLSIRQPGGPVLGERTLRSEAAACGALREPVALIIALMVDETRQRILEERRTERVARSTWQWQAAALAAGWLDLVPGFGVGPAIRLGATPPGAPSIELEGGYVLPKELRRDDAGASFQALVLGLSACPYWSSGPIRLHACPGAALIRVRGAGQVVDLPRTETRWVGALKASIGAQVRLARRVALRTDLGALLLFSRHRFVQRPDSTDEVLLHRLPRGVPKATTGIAVEF